MALTFGAVNTDCLVIGSAAVLDDLNPFTYLIWVNATTLTGGRVLFRKAQTGIKLFALNGTSGDVQAFCSRTGTNADYITNTTPLSATGTWVFLACTFDSAAAAGETFNIYKGTLTAAATECTYGTATDGSGSPTTDATGDQNIGGRSGQPSAFQGQIAVAAIFNTKLTASQIVSWQFQPRMMSGCVYYSELGFNGASTQPDYSGNGNAGTVTGATQSAHVPLGLSFGSHQIFAPAASAAAATPKNLPPSLRMRVA